MKSLIAIAMTILSLSSISFAGESATCTATCFIQRLGDRPELKRVIKSQAETRAIALAALASKCEDLRKQTQEADKSLASGELVTSMQISGWGARSTSFNANAACL
jgi:hypothetical protein